MLVEAREEKISLVPFREIRERTISSDIKLMGFLSELAEQQKKEWWEEQFGPVCSENRKKTLRDYKESRPFKQLCRKALKLSSQPRTEEEIDDFRHLFDGFLYEGLVYQILAGRQPPSKTLLSPEKTVELYEKFYPHASKVENIFGQETLYGISVPDGILVEESEKGSILAAVCEYTLLGSMDNLGSKFYAFTKDKNNFPALFDFAEFVFVVPKGSELPEACREGPRYRDVRFEHPPLLHSQAKDFCRSVYRFYRPEKDSLTLAEVQTAANNSLSSL